MAQKSVHQWLTPVRPPLAMAHCSVQSSRMAAASSGRSFGMWFISLSLSMSAGTGKWRITVRPRFRHLGHQGNQPTARKCRQISGYRVKPRAAGDGRSSRPTLAHRAARAGLITNSLNSISETGGSQRSQPAAGDRTNKGGGERAGEIAGEEVRVGRSGREWARVGESG